MAEKSQIPDDVAWYYTLAQLGIEMVAPIVVGVVLDTQLETGFPWFTVGGAVTGLVGGIWHLAAASNRRARKKTEAQRRESV